MSAAAHTPGSWEIDATSGTGGFEIWGGPIDSGAPQICSDDGDINRIEECKANARLIIAAPDLLAAAKKIEEAEAFHLACAECEGHEQPEICGHCFPLYDDARIMRRNAIAKAEGRP